MTAMATTAKVAQSCRRCRRLTRNGVYCPACQKQANAEHQNPLYNDSRYRTRRARILAAWRRLHGDLCVGYGDQPPHESSDLTLDHVIPLADGGDIMGEVVVRCRTCNGRKGAR